LFSLGPAAAAIPRGEATRKSVENTANAPTLRPGAEKSAITPVEEFR
jgi:hypothetical protein